MILQRNGSGQGQTTHPGAEQHHPPRWLSAAQHRLKQHLVALYRGTNKPSGPWISTSLRNLQEIDESQITNTINAKLSPNEGSVQTISLPQMGKRPVQLRLGRLEWLCFDDKCNKLDAFSCSSTLVSFFTKFQVSCADISPSCSHLMLDNSAGDIKG